MGNLPRNFGGFKAGDPDCLRGATRRKISVLDKEEGQKQLCSEIFGMISPARSIQAYQVLFWRLHSSNLAARIRQNGRGVVSPCETTTNRHRNGLRSRLDMITNAHEYKLQSEYCSHRLHVILGKRCAEPATRTAPTKAVTARSSKSTPKSTASQ